VLLGFSLGSSERVMLCHHSSLPFLHKCLKQVQAGMVRAEATVDRFDEGAKTEHPQSQCF